MKNNENTTNQNNQTKFSYHHAMHIILLLAIVISVGLLIWKFSNWGKYVDIDTLEDNPEDKYQLGMDEIFPLFSETENPLNDDGVTNILVFGNSPFSDDRDSKDSLANMIAEKANATVYNCAVSGSFLSCESPYFSTDENPMDAYSLYWLATLAINGVNDYYYPDALAALGDDAPPEATEVYDTLISLDLNTIDVLIIMYDASDYFMWRDVYNEENPTDVTSFAGNLEASIVKFQKYYPDIRIIVMSPTYAFVDVDGEYVSSESFYVLDDYTLSSYLGKEAESAFMCSVSFVDNLYGSITEENAKEYLRDNLHLNVEGRKVVADHFIYALNYFDKKK